MHPGQKPEVYATLPTARAISTDEDVQGQRQDRVNIRIAYEHDGALRIAAKKLR
jgi:hypothetical protein